MSRTPEIDSRLVIVYSPDDKYDQARWSQWFEGESLDYTADWLAAMSWLKIMQHGYLEREVDSADTSLGIMCQPWLELVQFNAQQMLGLGQNETTVADFTDRFGEPQEEYLLAGAADVYRELRERTEDAMSLTHDNAQKMFATLLRLNSLIRERVQNLVQERKAVEAQLEQAKIEQSHLQNTRAQDSLHRSEIGALDQRIETKIQTLEQRKTELDHLIAGDRAQLGELYPMIRTLLPFSRRRNAPALRKEKTIRVETKIKAA